MTRKEMVLEAMWSIGGKVQAEEIIAYLDDNLELPLADKVRIGQGVHGTLSTLFREGKVKRSNLGINPNTGREVYEYEVEEIQREPSLKVTKSYKEKCDELQLEMSRTQAKFEAAHKELYVYKNDSVKKDDLADVFYAAKESGNWDLISKLFVRTTNG